jgi:5-formyltetrahydrofolate cyclo-ligase
VTRRDDTARRKADARTAARASCRALTAGQRDEAADAIARRLAGMPELAGARSALAYAATAGEADAAPAVAVLRARGVRVAFPRVCGPGALALHWVDDEAGLSPGYCGILEPADASPEARPDEIDLVLVPGAAFDEECCRLGRGGGFYDRLLRLLAPGTVKIGIAFDEQIAATLPREAHDVHVDLVVTPTRVLRRG